MLAVTFLENEIQGRSYNLSYNRERELKIRKIGNGFGVLLPKQLLEEMHVTEGSVLHVERAGEVYEITPSDPAFSAALKAFRDTEPAHRNSYRELAK